MALPDHKTKVVATIGPASDSPAIMQQLLRAGMDVARLNFSHGDFEFHARVIDDLRAAAAAVGRPVTIMADLPGPKMRIGTIQPDLVELKPGNRFTLTSRDITGDAAGASVTFEALPRVVHPGDTLFLNDGIIQLRVESVRGDDVACRVEVGGPLRSRKGLNVPGIDLGISAFTERDRECLAFAMAHGVDAVSQSFVESAADIRAVREAAASLGRHPFVIAKLERARALDRLAEILDAADGVMVARGDLGVEIPVERVPVVQKWIIKEANLRARPVITATQMLESMTSANRPTRAEAADVANAVNDGTDAVMLSGESAMGQYPVESVQMLARIAREVEPYEPGRWFRDQLRAGTSGDGPSLTDALALSVETTVARLSPSLVVVPTRGGATPRNVTRFRLRAWIVALCTQPETARQLHFSWAVYPVVLQEHPDDWRGFVERFMEDYGIGGSLAVIVAGPSDRNPDENPRMELVEIGSRLGA